jgi:hypothetical protein
MASGDGVCAAEAQIENRSMLATSNGRLDMGTSGDRSRDNRVTVAALHESAYATFQPLLVVSFQRKPL